MTRINVAIQPAELPGKLLLAEHREIKRVPNVIKSGRYNMDGQPSEFTLGTGHVKFFYDKLGYLLNRYVQIHAECVRRGYNVQNYAACWDDVPGALMGSYTETDRDRQLLIERIESKGFALINF